MQINVTNARLGSARQLQVYAEQKGTNTHKYTHTQAHPCTFTDKHIIMTDKPTAHYKIRIAILNKCEKERNDLRQ